MGAKDTVMNNKQRQKFMGDEYEANTCIDWEIDDMLRAQAEITESMLKEQWIQAGRREVAEWGEGICEEHPEVYGSPNIRIECFKCWQELKAEA